MREEITKGKFKGKIELPGFNLDCYVLDDGRRMLSGLGVQKVLELGSKRGGKLKILARDPAISTFLMKKTRLLIAAPLVKFRMKGIRPLIHGFEATILVDICEGILSCRREGMLPPKYQLPAKKCEILLTAFAKAGIIALIDEVTGYDKVRDKNAIRKIIEKYILEEYREWTKTFPIEFYTEMFRLKKWVQNAEEIKKPGVVGIYTNNIIYERLAPFVLDELKRRNPVVGRGRRQRHHQWLTGDIGHPKLQEHLSIVIAFMKASNTWPGFLRLIDRARPRYGHTIPIIFDDEEID